MIRTLREYDELPLDELGPRVRVDYGGDESEEWLRGLLADLEDDGLVETEGDRVRLRR